MIKLRWYLISYKCNFINYQDINNEEIMILWKMILFYFKMSEFFVFELNLFIQLYYKQLFTSQKFQIVYIPD